MNNSNSLNDVTYNRIKEDIMNMTLEPGMDVSVQKLSERYGVSRTPVREAVVRLQQSGLVEIYPQRKTVVSKIDLQRVREEWFIRTSLESAVIDEFIRKCSELVADTMQELINKQKKYMDKKYFREFYIKDNRFHQLIFQTAGEELSWFTIEEVASHYNRIRLLYGKMEGVQPSDIDKHVKMVAATRKRDVEGMRKVVMEHSNTLLDRVQSMSGQYPQFF
ncbi:GntR family transcriptional regulator [Paenibacillus sp. FSL R7-0204]|uniref:DNA-binding GntR family transcriptional regulator n=1 Tax=Paenibacillus silagei TaxID=1670801 RepID=A0ABS4NYG8_9BACL|nr:MULTISPECIES: GntR family transcriptional regulator [Paenibacillus]ETT73321.1 GntR family transcriptional regulator [Paenibacillus sp. FSL R7-277]MBP2115097.1 DNA-binding GntR family transcriptional regulator [Paenibacillus silagei]OMF99706.1 GntR family transcriptional regulator [Paenibacillus sp. FSL R7-0333]